MLGKTRGIFTHGMKVHQGRWKIALCAVKVAWTGKKITGYYESKKCKSSKNCTYILSFGIIKKNMFFGVRLKRLNKIKKS